MIARQTRTKIWPAPVLTIQDLFWSYLIHMGWTPDGETPRCTAAGPLQQRDTGHCSDSISLMLVVITTTPHLLLTVKCGQHISLHGFNLLFHLSVLKVWLFDFILLGTESSRTSKDPMACHYLCDSCGSHCARLSAPPPPWVLGCGNTPRTAKPRSSQMGK